MITTFTNAAFVLNPTSPIRISVEPKFNYLHDRDMVKLTIDNIEITATEDQLAEVAQAISRKLDVINHGKGVA